MNNETTAPAQLFNQKELFVPCPYLPQGQFNAAPLIRAVLFFSNPEDLARTLDDVSFDLTKKYVEEDGDSDTIFMLRELRNALLEGSRAFAFDPTLAKEWEKQDKADKEKAAEKQYMEELEEKAHNNFNRVILEKAATTNELRAMKAEKELEELKAQLGKEKKIKENIKSRVAMETATTTPDPTTYCEFTERAKEYKAKGVSPEELLAKMWNLKPVKLDYFYLPSTKLSIEINEEFHERTFNAGPLVAMIFNYLSLSEIVGHLDSALETLRKQDGTAPFDMVLELRNAIAKGGGLLLIEEEEPESLEPPRHSLFELPTGAHIVSGETKAWPIVAGGKYYLQSVEEIGERGIFAVAYADGSVEFDRPAGLTRREGIRQVYQFTGDCFIDVED